MTADLAFDIYRPGDLPRCAELAADAWPIAAGLVHPADAAKWMAAYVRLALLATTWTRVVRVGGEVAGLCFGRVDTNMSPRQIAGMATGALALFFRLLAGKLGRLRDKAGFFRNFFKLELVTRKILSKFDAEITLLVIDSSLRGKGVGRRLVDFFVEHAGQEGASQVCLYTDIQSNWKFYEMVGFTKYGDFHDPYLSYLKKEPVYSFVYSRPTATAGKHESQHD